jgi:hypothetical protein
VLTSGVASRCSSGSAPTAREHGEPDRQQRPILVVHTANDRDRGERDALHNEQSHDGAQVSAPDDQHGCQQKAARGEAEHARIVDVGHLFPTL